MIHTCIHHNICIAKTTLPIYPHALFTFMAHHTQNSALPTQNHMNNTQIKPQLSIDTMTSHRKSAFRTNLSVINIREQQRLEWNECCLLGFDGFWNGTGQRGIAAGDGSCWGNCGKMLWQRFCRFQFSSKHKWEYVGCTWYPIPHSCSPQKYYFQARITLSLAQVKVRSHSCSHMYKSDNTLVRPRNLLSYSCSSVDIAGTP